MPTVSQLADRVSAVTGLSTSGDERSLVLGYLNQAYAYSVVEVGAYVSSFSKTLTAGDADYTIGVAPLDVTDIEEIRNLWVTDSSATSRIVEQISEREMMRLRQGSVSNGTPLHYALRGTRELLLYPPPSQGAVLGGSYLASAPTLVEELPATGEESTPTAIPSAFHYDVIANKAIALAMEYDNRFDESAVYESKYATGLDRLLAWTSRFGGTSVSVVDSSSYQGPRDFDYGV